MKIMITTNLKNIIRRSYDSMVKSGHKVQISIDLIKLYELGGSIPKTPAASLTLTISPDKKLLFFKINDDSFTWTMYTKSTDGTGTTLSTFEVVIPFGCVMVMVDVQTKTGIKINPDLQFGIFERKSNKTKKLSSKVITDNIISNLLENVNNK